MNPSLDEDKTNAVLDVLNKDGKSGFNSFAVGMSKSYFSDIFPIYMSVSQLIFLIDICFINIGFVMHTLHHNSRKIV